MAPLIGFFGGALWGVLQAKRKGGNGKDMAQYAVGFGIAFALLALFIAIIFARATA